MGMIVIGMFACSFVVLTAFLGLNSCGRGREGRMGKSQPVVREALLKGVPASPSVIELQAQGARHVQSRFENTGFFGQGGFEPAGMAGVAYALHPTDEMAESLADLGARLQRLAPDVRWRKRSGVVVEAELRCAVRFGDMDLEQAGCAAEPLDEAFDAGVGRVGGFRQQDGDVHSDRVRHV